MYAQRKREELQAWIHQSNASWNKSVLEREEHVIGRLAELPFDSSILTGTQVSMAGLIRSIGSKMIFLRCCLEILLRSAKCRPNLTIGGNPLYWEDRFGHIKPNHNAVSSQQCVKWEGIESWLEPRLLHYKNGVVEGLKSEVGLVTHSPASNR